MYMCIYTCIYIYICPYAYMHMYVYIYMLYPCATKVCLLVVVYMCIYIIASTMHVWLRFLQVGMQPWPPLKAINCETARQWHASCMQPCLLADSCMTDLLPKASMHHAKCELTDITLEAKCLHVDMCLAPFSHLVLSAGGHALCSEAYMCVCVCLCACGYPCPIYHSEPCKILRTICSNVHSEQ